VAGPFDDAIAGTTDRIVAALLPKLMPIVKQAAEAAEPTIRTVVREEVIPQAGVWAVAGLAAAAAVGAIVGYLVSRR
jgi:hypothetical protein